MEFELDSDACEMCEVIDMALFRVNEMLLCKNCKRLVESSKIKRSKKSNKDDEQEK